MFNFGSINHFRFLGKANRSRIDSEFSEMNNIIQESYNLDLRKYNYPL